MVKKQRDILYIAADIETQIADLSLTRGLTEIVAAKFDATERDEFYKLWTYYELETLAPVLHGRLHDEASKLNELIEELYEAINDRRATA